MTRAGGTWQPDLFNGDGIQRSEGIDRADQLDRARQEMRDTGSADLFDALADGKQYRVIIMGEQIATFPDLAAAVEAYTAQACVYCYASRATWRATQSVCCTVE